MSKIAQVDDINLYDSPISDQIAKHLGMHTGLPFSRGSAGLYALLRALTIQHGAGEVILPSLCCESVALAVIYAGHELRFAEVSPHSLCLTPETVAPLITERTRAVIVVHLYGVDASCRNFDSLRINNSGVVFIEDIAHAFGGRDSNGRLLGGSMDYTLLSFADSKIVAGDGGMILFSEKVTLDPIDVANILPSTLPRLPQLHLSLSLRNFVHGLAELYRKRPSARIDMAFRAVVDEYRSLIVSSGGIANEKAVADGFKNLEQKRITRYQNYLRYKREIVTKKVQVISLHEGSTCWRCSMLCHDLHSTVLLTDALREARVHASNHYFPLNLLITGERRPVAESLSARVINLWTDENTPSTMIDTAVHIINNF